MTEISQFAQTLFIIYYVTSPFALIGAFFIAISFVMVKSLRQRNLLSLVFGQAISDIFLSTHFLTMSIIRDPRFFTERGDEVDVTCVALGVMAEGGTLVNKMAPIKLTKNEKY